MTGAAIALVWAAARRTALTTVALQLVVSVSVVLQVVLVKVVLDVVLLVDSGEARVQAVVIPVLLLAVLAAFTSAAATLTGLRQRVLGELVSREVYRRIIGVTSRVDLTVYEDPAFYDQLYRVRVSAAARTLAITNGLVALVAGVAGAVASLLTLAALAPWIMPLVLLAGVPLLLASTRAAGLEYGFALWQSPRYRKILYLQNLLTGREQAKEVRAFSLGGALRQRWEQLNDSYLERLMEYVRRRVRLALLGHAGAGLLTAATLVYLLVLVDEGRLGLPAAGASLLAVRMLATRVNDAVSGMGQIFESSLFLSDLASFVARAPVHTVKQGTPPGTPGPDLEEVHLHSVSFTYPGAGEPTVRSVDMRLRKGEVIALVGENGSGKTTLAKILAGLYGPSEGALRWNGHDVAGTGRDAYREGVAVIFQDFVRYKFTARENIALGAAGGRASDDDVRLAAQRAGAAGFLEALPDGYDTMLASEYVGGVDLSLGQWQRIALARAFMRDAPLVILDEPSSALDARAEHDLFSRIRELFVGRTVLLISHRFSTVRDADHIYVLRAGQIVESGSHDTLMQRNGLYAELFTLQAKAYVP